MSTPVAERTRALRQNLTTEARRLTAEHGLSGFTIEQLCEHVGVSRRTFFNHFSSKEDAVVGIELGEADVLLREFRDGGLVPRGLGLVETVCRAGLVHVERHGFTRETARVARSAFEREPSLLSKALSNGEEQARVLVAALRAREHLAADDQRPVVAVAVAGAIMQAAATQFLADDTSADLDHLVLDALRTAADVTTIATPVLQETA